MATVFSYIIQKRYSQSYEDIATDALAYIINTHELAHQEIMTLLRSIISDLPDLRFNTQLTEGNIRPDMWGIEGSGTHVFVENKFWAGLTENQPISYIEELAAYEQPTLLLMVVPGAREQTMIIELSRRLNEGRVEFEPEIIDSNGIIWCVKTTLGPMVALSSWPRLLEIMEKASINNPEARIDLRLLGSLCEAADIDRFIAFNAEDLNNQLTPAMILQVKQVIRDSESIGIRKGFLSKEGLTESVNWNRAGKYIWLNQPKCVGIWFGLDYELWKENGLSPLWVKFSTSDFGRALEVETILQYPRNAFQDLIKLQDGSIAIPIYLETGADKDQVNRSVVDQLRSLARILSVLCGNTE